ncbi:hypothetical protein D3C71_382480 [compost metagenome]
MRVTLIAGLPGSGKTFLLRSMREDGATCIDDIRGLSDLPRQRVPWLAISDVNFCRKDVRDAAEFEIARRFGPVDLEWTFFENDPDQCRANAVGRNDGRNVNADIDALCRLYVVPEDAKCIPVFGAQTSEAAPILKS